MTTTCTTITKIALAAALVLGAASAALASNENDQSVSGAQAAREMNGNPLPWWWNVPAQGAGSFAQAGNAYGYVASPTQQENLSHKKSRQH
jgi:hypothetical protein